MSVLSDYDTAGGGPAYPMAFTAGAPGSEYTVTQRGMSLRDYFAAQAIPTAHAAYPNVRDWQLKRWFGDTRTDIGSEEIIGRIAYEIADGMLKARKQ